MERGGRIGEVAVEINERKTQERLCALAAGVIAFVKAIKDWRWVRLAGHPPSGPAISPSFQKRSGSLACALREAAYCGSSRLTCRACVQRRRRRTIFRTRRCALRGFHGVPPRGPA